MICIPKTLLAHTFLKLVIEPTLPYTTKNNTLYVLPYLDAESSLFEPPTEHIFEFNLAQ